MSDRALELRRVEVPFGSAPGLGPFDLVLHPGERVVLVGASGVGKTTLLRAIAGLAPIAGGEIRLSGRTVDGLPPERRGAVYLHQTAVLFPHLDVAENVAFPLRVRGVPRTERRERALAALRVMRLEGLDARSPEALSGGQRQRVALARALLADPAVLLLDEPLSALDPSLRNDVREAIVTAADECGAAALVVTHDLDDAAALAHRIGVMIDGRLEQLATPRILFDAPATLDVARFLGWPNEVEGVLDGADGSVVSALGRIRLDEKRRGQAGPGRVTLTFPSRAAVLVAAPREGDIPCTVRSIRHTPGGVAARVLVGGVVLEVAGSEPHEAEPASGPGPAFIRIRPALTMAFPR